MLLRWFIYLRFWLIVSVVVRAMWRVVFFPTIYGMLAGRVESSLSRSNIPHVVPRRRFFFLFIVDGLRVATVSS